MNEHCSSCGADVEAQGAVNLVHEGESRLLCLRCYNEFMARRLVSMVFKTRI